MGMWDKDKQMGNQLDRAIGLGEPFVVLAAELTGEKVTTELGDADQARLRVARLDDRGMPRGQSFDAHTIASAIVAKVAEADDEDFPAVCELRRVQSKRYKGTSALVLQFVGEYAGPDPDTGEVRS